MIMWIAYQERAEVKIQTFLFKIRFFPGASEMMFEAMSTSFNQ